MEPTLRHGFEHEHRDLPVRPRLVLRVVGPRLDRALPPHGLLVARDLARRVVAFDRAILQLDVRVLLEVEVPDGILLGAAERRDHRVDALVLDAHERRLAELAGLRANRGQYDHGLAAKVTPLLAVRRLEPHWVSWRLE